MRMADELFRIRTGVPVKCWQNAAFLAGKLECPTEETKGSLRFFKNPYRILIIHCDPQISFDAMSVRSETDRHLSLTAYIKVKEYCIIWDSRPVPVVARFKV